jgi:hypothetical protein
MAVLFLEQPLYCSLQTAYIHKYHAGNLTAVKVENLFRKPRNVVKTCSEKRCPHSNMNLFKKYL